MSSEQSELTRYPSVGVDLGGTSIRAVVFGENMKVLVRHQVPTEAQEGAERVIRRVANCVRQVLNTAEIETSEIAGVGVGAAGLTNWRTGVVVLASNLGWRNVPLRQHLGDALGRARVEVDKDTNVAALAEARLGAGRAFRDFLYVAAGTGIGGGLILNGSLYRGATGGAGDIGHIVVDPDGPPCGCGDHGCVEVFSSGAGIVNRTKELLARSDSAATLSVMKSEKLTAEIVFDAAQRDDAVAVEVIETAGTALGQALADYVNINNPEAILLGGGLMRAGSLYSDLVSRELRRRTLPTLGEAVKLVLREVQEDTSAMGAALLLSEPSSKEHHGGT